MESVSTKDSAESVLQQNIGSVHLDDSACEMEIRTLNIFSGLGFRKVFPGFLGFRKIFRLSDLFRFQSDFLVLVLLLVSPFLASLHFPSVVELN